MMVCLRFAVLPFTPVEQTHGDELWFYDLSVVCIGVLECGYSSYAFSIASLIRRSLGRWVVGRQRSIHLHLALMNLLTNSTIPIS